MADERLMAAIRPKLGDELSDEDVAYLLSQMDTIEGEAGTAILTRGEENDTLFLLVEGEMVVTVAGEGRDLELSRVQAGQWIGELSFVEPGVSSATVTSATPFMAQALSGARVEQMINENAHAASGLIRALSREIAVRLANTSSGVLERVSDDKYQVADAEEKKGWFSDLLGRVFGRQGDAG